MKSSQIIEERLNAYSHGLGFVLAVLGLFWLLQKELNEPYEHISVLVYGISLTLLFLASTIYHSAINPPIKRKLRIADHISIYYLIAGTYTPICLLVLVDSKGWLLLYTVWGLALFGTFLKLFFTGRFEVFSLVLYGLMGWLVVIDFPFLSEHLSLKGLYLMGLGGAFYTLGIVFYALKKIPYNHFIWHLFVLGGAISHWCMIRHILEK